MANNPPADQRFYDKQRAQDPSRRFEMSAAWRGCAHKMRRDNPICQAIHDGKQCMRPSRMVHHLIAPEHAPHLKLDPKNLVALCDPCHPRTSGDPGVRTYVPTIVNVMGKTYTHTHAPVQPAHRAELAPTGTPGARTGFATSQPAAKVNAGLDADSIAALLAGI